MSTSHFIPEVWAASILENFRNKAVLTGLANRDYEGDLKAGNTVHIPGIVDIQVKDYKTGVVAKPGGGGTLPRTTAPDEVSDTGIEIKVDQEKSFDFIVDDIDAAQANQPVMDKYSESAAAGLVEDAETFLTTMILTSGTAATGLTAPTNWETAYDVVRGLRRRLTSAKVPQANRTLLVNAAFEEFLLSDGSKLVAFDKSNTTEGLREAIIGRLLGFDVVVSPWVDDSKPTAAGIYTPSLVFISQVNKTESMRAENKFADRVRGLHVYGGKITRPTAVQVFKAA